MAKRVFFRRRAHELLEAIERLQGKAGRLLDVGCGIGTELEVARERGWRGTGIELSAASLKVARSNGLQVIDKPLADADLKVASFDCVTINHALEHIAQVRPLLDQVRQLLRPAGLLFVSVPNLHAWPHRVGAHRLGLAFNDDHISSSRAPPGRLLEAVALCWPSRLAMDRLPARRRRVPGAVSCWNGAGTPGARLEIFALAPVLMARHRDSQHIDHGETRCSRLTGQDADRLAEERRAASPSTWALRTWTPTTNRRGRRCPDTSASSVTCSARTAWTWCLPSPPTTASRGARST
jgi:SAM-dependent methyltransferase